MTTVYKISGYVRWDAKGDVITGSKGGGSYTPPVSSGGLDGSGVAGQVAVWLDENTLIGEDPMWQVDSTGYNISTVMPNAGVFIGTMELSGNAFWEVGAIYGIINSGGLQIVPPDVNGEGILYLGQGESVSFQQSIYVAGINDNISLFLIPKGTGVVQTSSDIYANDFILIP
jgi:hypothetical protein